MDEPGTYEFTVERSGKVDLPASVAYRNLDGSASMLEQDYQQIFHNILNFAARETTKTLTVTVLDDDIPEGNETFSLELFDASGEV